MKPIVIIESPFAANMEKCPSGLNEKEVAAWKRQEIETNLRYVRAAMRDCLLRQEAPYASHALYTQEGVLNDDIKEERQHGIESGFAFRLAAKKTVVYTDRGMSGGMKMGIEHSNKVGIPVEYRSLPQWAERIILNPEE